MTLSDENMAMWRWLCSQGGVWTTRELADVLGRNPEDLSRKLHKMTRSELVASFPPVSGSRRNRYGVTGTCRVPYGVRVAETQA